MHRRGFLTLAGGAAGAALIPARAAPGGGGAGEIVRLPMSDGAVIGLEVAGPESSPSVLVVHGAGASRVGWRAVAALLRPRFRTCLMDRRGRGESTDGPAWSLERESRDVAEVAARLPAPAFVIGHSLGALITLEALRLTARFAKAVLYEPPLPAAGAIGGDDPRPVCAAVAAGDDDRAMTTFFRDYVLMAPATVAALRSAPGWSDRVKLAPTVCREVTARAAYRFAPARFARVRTPTLFLLGGDSPAPVRAGTLAGAAALAHARVELLPGQAHVAHLVAPELVARDASAFFAG